jgi:hypothetical protein
LTLQQQQQQQQHFYHLHVPDISTSSGALQQGCLAIKSIVMGRQIMTPLAAATELTDTTGWFNL